MHPQNRKGEQWIVFLQIHPVFPSKTGHIRLGHLPPKDRALKKVAEEQKTVLYPNAFLCFRWLAVACTLFSWGFCQVLAPAAAWYLTLCMRSEWPNGSPLPFVAQVTQPQTLVILKWSFFLHMSSDFITCWSFPSIFLASFPHNCQSVMWCLAFQLLVKDSYVGTAYPWCGVNFTYSSSTNSSFPKSVLLLLGLPWLQ